MPLISLAAAVAVLLTVSKTLMVAFDADERTEVEDMGGCSLVRTMGGVSPCVCVRDRGGSPKCRARGPDTTYVNRYKHFHHAKKNGVENLL